MNIELAQKILVTEKSVDEHEMALDELCTKIIARRQPAASDLRLIMTVSKATRDLERMGDEAEQIAKMAIAISESGTIPHGYTELRNLGSRVQQMINDTLTAFARYDVDTALSVAHGDKRVDQEYDTAIRELITYMMEDPRNISRSMNIMWALRELERIGDHAGNIAEHVIYLVKGLDVLHQTAKEMTQSVQREQ
jgi:phosphate transport system protein